MYWLKDPAMISFLIFLITTIGYIVSELLNAKRKTRMPLACIAIISCLTGIGMLYQNAMESNRTSTRKFIDATIISLESNDTDKVITSLKQLKKQLAKDNSKNVGKFMDEAIKTLTPERPAAKSNKITITSCRMDPKIIYKCFLAESHWLPSKSIVKKAEPLVIEYIKRKNPKIFKNLSEYKCQYMGIIKKDKKLLFCNFFMSNLSFHNDWRNRPVLFIDGGDNYFHVEYDIESKKCISFSVNGEA